MVGSIEGRAPIALVGDSLLTTDQSGLSISVRDNTPGSFKVKGELKVSWMGDCIIERRHMFKHKLNTQHLVYSFIE